jgi:hypothetical protein
MNMSTEFYIATAFGLMCIAAVILLTLPSQGPRPPRSPKGGRHAR